MSKFLRTVDTNVCKMSQKGKRDSMPGSTKKEAKTDRFDFGFFWWRQQDLNL